MALSNRKEKILSAVVDSYITSCEPISSQEIRDKHLPDVSSATIRNELAALEEMGYLVQPHTSAGRIPTAEAYRLYVEKLMPKRKLSYSELNMVKRYFDHKIVEIDDMLKATVRVISEITNLTSVAYAHKSDSLVVKSIKFVKIDSSQALVVIVTDGGLINNATMSIAPHLSDLDLLAASEFVSGMFCGYSIGEITSNPNVVANIQQRFRSFFDTVIDVLNKYAHESNLGDIVLEGSSKILEQPEFANITKAKAMLSMLEAKRDLVPILQSKGEMSFNIQIGQEQNVDLPEYAVVTATYTVGGKSIGNAGVIGPMRMDYPKIVSLLDYIGKTINSAMSKGIMESDSEI
ncbi:MAG: heat-inducible transcriptional repressor HrcA [Clostridiales bacterium]|jgi:heat-inducible transcriptional repressor|nr:heat-inducible transcriptional repressor HrcA [Clostridiales bacterium]